MNKKELTFNEICQIVDESVSTKKEHWNDVLYVGCVTDNPNYNPAEYSQEIADDVEHISAQKFLENRSKICPVSLDIIWWEHLYPTLEGNYTISQEQIDNIKKEFKNKLKKRKIYEVWL